MRQGPDSHEPWDAEPWKISDHGDYIQTEDDDMAIYVDEVGWHNAARIIACVNFCKGIPTETLIHRDTSDNREPPLVKFLGGFAATIIVPMKPTEPKSAAAVTAVPAEGGSR